MIERAGAGAVEAEVVGFAGAEAAALAFGGLEGVEPGARAFVAAGAHLIAPGRGWLGRVVDGRGRPLDGRGPLPAGREARPFRASPPPAHARARLGEAVETGVRAIDVFATLRRGQRLGLFAGTGVGKSTLMAMLARHARAEVNVIGLIGERGREVREFIEDELGPDGLARSVVVVATSDEPALARRQAGELALAVAEHFRDEGANVLLMLDSVTRYAQALREIGLAAGEPPTAKGYTPGVFAELPRLLERAGPGCGDGAITALFTVLAEQDDLNDPVADAVRGVLDGHVVMARAIAERGRYPAIDILKSLSRTMPGVCPPEFREAVARARRLMATHADMEEMIRLGIYKRGATPEVDEAIARVPLIEAFLAQGKEDATSMRDAYHRLAEILA
jgi:flagellum-specific ATP synthase